MLSKLKGARTISTAALHLGGVGEWLATLPVRAAGAGLMPTPPHRPRPHPGGIGRRRPDQPGEQMAQLPRAQRDQHTQRGHQHAPSLLGWPRAARPGTPRPAGSGSRAGTKRRSGGPRTGPARHPPWRSGSPPPRPSGRLLPAPAPPGGCPAGRRPHTRPPRWDPQGGGGPAASGCGHARSGSPTPDGPSPTSAAPAPPPRR
jgi:hypothetical protein